MEGRVNLVNARRVGRARGVTVTLTPAEETSG